MFQTGALESAIRLVLAWIGACPLEALKERVPYYAWNQVFAAVDRLNRGGTVTLQPESSDYRLSLAPRPLAKAHRVTPS